MTEQNPYTTSAGNPYAGGPPPDGSPGMIHQIRVVAILMIVHGGLSALVGLFYVGIGAVVPQMMEMEAQMRPADNPGPSPFAGYWFMFGVYAAMGAPALVAGGLQIFAGARNYDLRSRTLGIVAAAGGLLAGSTCYCGPTAIALAVYALIVLLNPTVAEAFRRRAEGATAATVLAQLTQAAAGWTPPAPHQAPPDEPPPPPNESPPSSS